MKLYLASIRIFEAHRCKYSRLRLPFFQLSWVRKKDYHILTSGRHSFTRDDRFVPLHQEGSDEWLLQIKSVKTGDNGTYQCQVYPSRFSLRYGTDFKWCNCASQFAKLGCVLYHATLKLFRTAILKGQRAHWLINSPICVSRAWRVFW
jgi:hypothetical protein